MKKGSLKNRKRLNWLVLAFSAIVLSIMPIAMLTDASSNFADEVPSLVRTANLAAPNGAVNPHGVGTYNVYPSGNRELEVEIEDVSLADGTVLSAFVDGNQIGTITLSAQKGKVRLKTSLGDTVPTVNDGMSCEVKNGSTVLVTGVFGGVSGTPTPTVSPTASPTASPTVSPTASPSPSPTVSPSPTPNNESEITAILTGSTVNGVVPRGMAAYEIHSSRTEFEVNLTQINLPNGTSVAVFVDGNQVGTATISSGVGRLRLRSDRGETVPVVADGMSCQVKNGSTTILSGTFHGSASPAPSPTPSGQGRYFETHLSGSQMTPPVTTTADGEVKVSLNETETQATILGEFHRLSSNETSAKIEVTVGGTTATVHDLGTIGGTNGNFATATIPVTANQVNQLRTGLWVATISSVNNPSGEIRGTLTSHNHQSDFDGDGMNDLSVFRPSTNSFYSLGSANSAFLAISVGTTSDKVVSGDFDGDGKTDGAVFSQNIVPGLGVWQITRSADGGRTIQQFGLATDTPVNGDFDGDGRKDLAVYRSGMWFIQRSSDAGFQAVQFGLANDVPVASDYDGDGRDDIAVYRPSAGDWYVLRSSDNAFWAVHFGANGDIPSTGDFDGDNKSDAVVFRPSTGSWYVLRSNDLSFYGVPFGTNGDVPVAGNYDADNKTDIAVWRPSTGYWYILRSSDLGFTSIPFGTQGDIPAVAK
jgi:hypothetical protein